MRLRIPLWGLSRCRYFGSVAFSQSNQPTTDQRLDRFEQRLNALEQKHQAELKTRDEEIARLRDELNHLQQRPATTAPTKPQDEIEKTKQDILKDIESKEAPPLTLRMPANFNPDLAVIGDFKGNVSSNNNNRRAIDSIWARWSSSCVPPSIPALTPSP